MYANVNENLTFLTSRYKYVCVHIGAGGRTGGGGVENVIFQETLHTYYKNTLFVKIIFTLAILSSNFQLFVIQLFHCLFNDLSTIS